MTGWKEIIVWEFYDAKQNLHGSKYVGELIRCKKCAEHGKRTNYCAIWKCNTSPNGYCHRGRKEE